MSAETLIPPTARIVRGRHGNFFILRNDILSDVFERYGEWAEKEVLLYAQVIKNADWIFEVGAHIGTHSVPLSRMCQRLVCFEPQALAFQALSANLLLNNCTNARACQLALGQTNEWLVLQEADYSRPVNSGGYEVRANLSKAGQGQLTQVLPLDEFWRMSGRPSVSFMKIDVEGMEAEVLRGAEQLLSTCKPPLLLESNYWKQPASNAEGDEFYAWLAALGYNLYWFCSAGFNPHNFNGVQENVMGSGGDINILALPLGLTIPLKLQEFSSCNDLQTGAVRWL